MNKKRRGVPFQVWVLAARPRTLPAALVPVGVASALAAAEGAFVPAAALLCLAFALLLQIGANFANDYFDYVKGADTAGRVGPARAVASGWVSPAAMLGATWLVFSLAFASGLPLIFYGGWGLLPLGVVCVLCGLAYTGGPFPLGYNGLGEVFVFVFFGLVAVCFTFFVQAGSIPPQVWVIACGIGALSCNILAVNNYRDIDEDRVSGKKTLAVRFGPGFARAEYLGLFLVGWAAVLALPVFGYGWPVLLPLLLAPESIRLILAFYRAENREDFNGLLSGTALFLLVYGTLLAAGLLIYGAKG